MQILTTTLTLLMVTSILVQLMKGFYPELWILEKNQKVINQIIISKSFHASAAMSCSFSYFFFPTFLPQHLSLFFSWLMQKTLYAEGEKRSEMIYYGLFFIARSWYPHFLYPLCLHEKRCKSLGHKSIQTF